MNPLLTFHLKAPSAYFGGLLPGQIDVDFRINFHKIKNMSLRIVVSCFHCFNSGGRDPIFSFFSSAKRYLAMCIRGKHNGLLNHLNQLLFALKKDTFVDFQLRFVFIAKIFSSNCFKTVT